MIDLPAWAVPNAFEPSFIDAGATLRSALSTSAVRVDRAGGHFAARFGFPPLVPEQGRILLSRLLKATSEGLRVELPLIGVDQGAPGAPVVDGGTQAGMTLAIRGATPGYQAREGFWLSIVTGGRRFVHAVTADITVAGDGKAALPIFPPLRVQPADGSTVELTAPMMEGLVSENRLAWEISLAHHMSLSVTIEEMA